MAKKKERAFFICPRWNEVAAASGADRPVAGGSKSGSAKIMSAIKGGQPVARSTLRKALLAARHASGAMFNVDDYIVDERTNRSR